MKQKLFTLLTLLVLCVTGAWATGEVFYVKFKNSSNVTQSPDNYFSYDKGTGTSVSWSSKGKHSCTYGGETYSDVIKMESSTRCYFTTEAEATITIVQTISNATGDKLKFDNTNLNSSMANTTVSVNSDNKYNEYVITGVEAGTHTITRQSETGLAYVKVEYTGEVSLVVADPSISWNSSTNQATITCSTDGATIYYTTDGSEPTTSSTVFSSAIPLTNSTSIRAIAKKSDVVSNLVKSDCYVNHSTADKYLATIGYKDGTREDATKYKWTSSDGNYIITMANTTREMGYVNLAGSQDGFKLNAVDVYTLQPSSEIKITKLVVVGKTWLQGSSGNASTISVDDFTPASGTFFDYVTDGETYVKTNEFTPSPALDYGDAVIIRPGNNQLGAYIEIYGEIKTYDITYATELTGGSISGATTAKSGQTVTVTTIPNESYSLKALTITKTSDNTDVTASCSVSGNTFVMPAFDVTVSATFVAAYAVTYDLNGGEGDVPTQAATEEGGKFNLAAAPTRTCYTFNGWKCNVDNVTYAANYEYTMTAAPTTFTAQWTANYSTSLDFAEVVLAKINDGTEPPAIETFLAGGNMVAETLGSGSVWETGSGWGETIKIGFLGYKLKNSGAKLSFLAPAGKLVTIVLGSIAANVTLSKNGTTSTISNKSGDDAETIVTPFVTGEDMLVSLTTSSNGTVTLKKIIISDYATATISAAEYATFYNAEKALDFSTTGITVYTAQDKETSVGLTEITSGQVPANTPVVLYKAGANGTAINVPVIASAAAIEGTNDLRISTGTDVDNMYVLAMNPTIGFYPWTGTNLPAGKIYLQGKASYGARSFIGFDSNTTTSIDNVVVKTIDANAPMYNLAGQRVNKSYKGVVIVNGKKMLNK